MKMVGRLEARLIVSDRYLMDSTWVIDLRHYLTPAGALPAMPRPARVRAEYWTRIVAQGPRFDEPVRLRCRQRPAHRLCARILDIGPDPDSDDMVWRCPVCGDNGIIRGWQGIFWDNGDLADHSQYVPPTTINSDTHRRGRESGWIVRDMTTRTHGLSCMQRNIRRRQAMPIARGRFRTTAPSRAPKDFAGG